MSQKVLKLPDLTLFTVSAIVLLDTLAASASIGASSLTWWLLLGVLFCYPLGLSLPNLGQAIQLKAGYMFGSKKLLGKNGRRGPCGRIG